MFKSLLLLAQLMALTASISCLVITMAPGTAYLPPPVETKAVPAATANDLERYAPSYGNYEYQTAPAQLAPSYAYEVDLPQLVGNLKHLDVPKLALTKFEGNVHDNNMGGNKPLDYSF